MTKEEQLEQCLIGAGVSPASASIWASALFLIESQRVVPSPPPLKWVKEVKHLDQLPDKPYWVTKYSALGGVYTIHDWPTNGIVATFNGETNRPIGGYPSKTVEEAFADCYTDWKEIWEKEMGGGKTEA